MAEIDISKLTKIYYSIGELAKMLDVNASLLRFWEKEFEFQVGKKNAKGNRMYGIKEIAFINHVYQLVKIQGFTLDGAKQQLKQNKPSAGQTKMKKQQELIDRLESIKERLTALKTW
jgi:DNA-binding transcriptional MerR regulator